jgi:tRNA pseudouridine38-40 synthase
MNAAARLLLQYKDFECFSKKGSSTDHFLCDIYSASWQDEGNRLVFTITANRFLRNMVRAITATLLKVGSGRLSEDAFRDIIVMKKPAASGTSVPPCGLYHAMVEYPQHLFITKQ